MSNDNKIKTWQERLPEDHLASGKERAYARDAEIADLRAALASRPVVGESIDGPELREVISQALIPTGASMSSDGLQAIIAHIDAFIASKVAATSISEQPGVGPAELHNAFMTLESDGGESRKIVLKFNQRADAYAMHEFLVKGCTAPTEAASVRDARTVISEIKRVSDWMNKLPVPTDGCTRQMIRLQSVIDALAARPSDTAPTTSQQNKDAS